MEEALSPTMVKLLTALEAKGGKERVHALKIGRPTVDKAEEAGYVEFHEFTLVVMTDDGRAALAAHRAAKAKK